jgi:PAS domain S-box-containing protein
MAVQLLSQSTAAAKTGNSTNYSGKPITEIITNGFFSVDHQWTVTHWNEAAEKILSVRAQDIIGKNLWEKFADIIPLNFYAVYHKAFLNNIPVHFEEYWAEMGTWFDVITYYSGDTLSISFKASSPPIHSGHPAQQLRILNELYQFITQVTNDCLWEWNIQAKELFWIDGGHKRVFGYPIENSLIPQSFWESRLHPDDKVRVLAKLKKTIGEAVLSLWEDEYRFEKANGDYAFVHDRAHIVYDEDNKAIRMIGATQDITARKLAEIQLKSGLELMDDKKSNLVLKIKNVIVELAHYSEEPLTVKFSEFLSQKLNYDYTYLSNTFSEVQGITIEKFFITHKIERVKELLVYNKFKLTEIAYLMHYSSVAHLSAQFKKVTGLTPTHFKKLREKRRTLLENM